MILVLIPVILAYVLGSFPSSVWLGRWLKGIDLRDHGSGNAGATNAFRVLGIRIGIAVLAMDIIKGFLAVNLSHLQHEIPTDSEGWMILRIGLGALAVAGHIYPIFARFRGGKGVATMAGIGLAIHPLASLVAIGVYALVFVLFKYSALGSIAAVLSYPVLVIAVFQSEFKSVWIFSIAVPVLTLLTHRSNIIRLLKGQEKPVLKN